MKVLNRIWTINQNCEDYISDQRWSFTYACQMLWQGQTDINCSIKTTEILHERNKKMYMYKDLTIGSNPSLLSWLAEILDIKEGWLFEFHRKEEGMKDLWCIAQNAALFVSLL